MARLHLDRWLPPAALLVGGLLAANSLRSLGGAIAIVAAALLAVAIIFLAWRLSPLRRGTHIDHARARELAGADGVIVYWRPGCQYCVRLRRSLGDRAGEVTWVNIWADDEAAAFVRSINGGNEQVPTVATGTGERLDPTADAVVERLGV
jgi:glutaredoxin